MMRSVFILMILAFTWTGSAADAGRPPFDRANQLYEEGRYLEAVEAYRALLTNGRSVVLHFNLGNAYFKAGEIGRAIAEYRQAQRLAPRDPDVHANLKFAKERVQGPSYEPGWFQQKAGKLTTTEWARLTTVTFWLFFGLLIAGECRSAWRRSLRRWASVAGVTAAGLLALTVVVSGATTATQTAVVTGREAVVRLGPFEESQSTMTLNPGAEVKVLDRKESWLQVTADGRQVGWVKADAVIELDS